ncbi:HxlR family transcriptional regulator [Prosthecobacter fusiformis]|uniref:HxlR family transcriptional regulator n=1 Tax=Prosthecobacter fusiformis TaxID=48464 RepID=A0A4R7RKA6_9BACT|nr:helix-turn-helix domain-containing protein [Prosthecobacter fusiformis]TDU63182.1 HxlR family transcriptional regulator [Prosthecobacter fusiformis]
MTENRIQCDVEELLRVIAGRWKVVLIRELETGPRRHGQLLRSLTGITQKMLTQRLRELEADGLIQHRDVLEGKVRHVEYSLTEWGVSVKEVVMHLHHWAVAHHENLAGRKRLPLKEMMH